MQAWIDGTATTVADAADLDAILGRRPPEGVTLVSGNGRRTLHITLNGDRSGLSWEAEDDLFLSWGPVPPGAPAGQVEYDAEYAYDNPWFTARMVASCEARTSAILDRPQCHLCHRSPPDPVGVRGATYQWGPAIRRASQGPRTPSN